MAGPNDLTTLANVRSWLNLQGNTSDPLLGRFISACSQTLLSFLNRPCLSLTTYTEVSSGHWGRRIMLRQWPVIQVNSVIINNATVPLSPTPTASLLPSQDPSGYMPISWDGNLPGRPAALDLVDYTFWPGIDNIQVVYQAGYYLKETWTIPSGKEVILTQGLGSWKVDNGVTYTTTGTALTAVASAPAQGQYMLDASNVGGYIFSAADVGQQVTIGYSFIPFDLEQACLDFISLRYNMRGRLGIKSTSLAGQETTAYDTSAIPDFIGSTIQQYRRVTMA